MDLPQPSEKDTTSLMDKYNFINPVSVTVIYEEDEEKVKEINIEDKHVHNTINQGVHNHTLIPSSLGKDAKYSTKHAKSKENIKSTLNKVAQNMAHIVQHYNNYILYSNMLNLKEALRLKRNYISIKYRYFQQSFEIAHLLLLPQKTNKGFTENFVQKIIEMSNVKIDPMYVKSLYNNFISWVEQRHHKMFINNQHSPRFTNLNQVYNLQTRPVANSEKVSGNIERISSTQDNFSKENKVTIFSAGPKGNEIILSVDAKYLDATAQIHESTYPTSCQNEMQKPEQNIFSSSKNTTSSSKVNYRLRTQYNSQINDLSENENMYNGRNIEKVEYNSMPGSFATDCTNPLLRSHKNLNNIDNTIRKYNRGNQLAEDVSQYSVSSDRRMGNQLSFNSLSNQMPALRIPNIGQSPSHYGANNVITKHTNKCNNPTMNQNEMQHPKQNMFSPLNATSSNIVNYPLSMPTQCNEINNDNQTTNLRSVMNTLNGLRNHKFEHSNFSNTLPGYPKNHCYNFVNRVEQSNQQDITQNSISRNNAFRSSLAFNSSHRLTNPTTFQDRPNWFNIQHTYVSNNQAI